MAIIKFTKVGKSFGKTPIVHAVDLEIADGEFAVVVGPSGCGKSTLLRMVAGLESISTGEIWIANRLANDVAPQHRNASMVFQSYALVPHLSARDNIGFGPRIRGEPRKDVDAKVARAAAILDLAAIVDRYPRHLSGGQRQRVAMGRTMVRTPDVFLFDEPLSNLDANLRVLMRAEIKATHEKLRSTVLYVTHDQIEAMTLADRIVVMNAGRIEQVGAPLDLYDMPATRFVGSFLGSLPMSFIPAIVDGSDDDVRIRGPAGSLLVTIPRAMAGAFAATPTFDLGFRAEDLKPAGPTDGIPFTIDLVEPTGAETILLGKIDGIPVQGSFRERLRVSPGDTIHVKVDPARIHAFDTATGLRL